MFNSKMKYSQAELDGYVSQIKDLKQMQEKCLQNYRLVQDPSDKEIFKNDFREISNNILIAEGVLRKMYEANNRVMNKVIGYVPERKAS